MLYCSITLIFNYSSSLLLYYSIALVPYYRAALILYYSTTLSVLSLLLLLLLVLLLLLLFVIVVHCYCFCFVIEQTSLNIISVNAIGDEPLSTQGRALRGPPRRRGGAPRVGIAHGCTRAASTTRALATLPHNYSALPPPPLRPRCAATEAEPGSTPQPGGGKTG